LVLRKVLVPKHYYNAKMLGFHDIVWIETCAKQNNKLFTGNLIHAKILIFPFEAFLNKMTPFVVPNQNSNAEMHVF